MRFVDLEDAIEACVEDRRQRDNLGGKGISLPEKGQADPDDEFGRTKVDATEWDINLSRSGKRTTEDCDHDGAEVSESTIGFVAFIEVQGRDADHEELTTIGKAFLRQSLSKLPLSGPGRDHLAPPVRDHLPTRIFREQLRQVALVRFDALPDELGLPPREDPLDLSLSLLEDMSKLGIVLGTDRVLGWIAGSHFDP